MKNRFFAKGWLGAYVMALLALIGWAIPTLIFIFGDQASAGLRAIFAFLPAILVALFMGAVFGAFLIIRLDETHFGPVGALRWFATGLLAGTLIALLDWAFEPGSSLAEIVFMILRPALALVAYWLFFRLGRKQTSASP